MKKKLFASLAAACFCTAAFAATEIYVSAGSGNDNYNGASWETAFKTLQKAVSSLRPNEETIIYLEADAVFDTGGQLDFGENKLVSLVGSNTTLRAATLPGNQGGEGSRIVRAVAGSSLSLKGLVFENGRQVEYHPGGAVFFAGNTLEVDSCVFLNNESGSGGAAVASRGKDVVIRNSYFEGNYSIGGGSTGAAIMQAGLAGNEPTGTLLVENCTFYKNSLTDGTGTAISSRDNASGYSNLKEMKVVNCTFLENSSTYDNQAAIDITDSDRASIRLINNTFYGNDGALRIGDVYAEEGGEILMINNLIFANKSGIFGADGYSVADMRAPIIAYNNIVVGGDRGVNENIDDDCFNDEKAACNNKVETTATYPLSMVALSTQLSDEGSFVPYLALTAANSDAVDAGYAGQEYASLVPDADVRGVAKVGIRDIGAYEYADKSGIFETNADAPDFFVISQNDHSITITNKANRAIDLRIADLSGRTLYAGKVQEALSISKSDLRTHCVVLVLNNGTHRKAKKCLID